MAYNWGYGGIGYIPTRAKIKQPAPSAVATQRPMNAVAGPGPDSGSAPGAPSSSGGFAPGRSGALGFMGLVAPGPMGLAASAANMGLGAAAAQEQMDMIGMMTGQDITGAGRAGGIAAGATGISGLSPYGGGLGGYGNIGVGGTSGMMDMADPAAGGLGRAEAAEAVAAQQAENEAAAAVTAEDLDPFGGADGEGDGDDGLCFITTAVSEHLGKPDDCDELETLRWFRDNVLALTDDGQELIDEYYDVAPGIVSSIKESDDPGAVFDDLNSSFITPAVVAVKEGRNDDAKLKYIEMVEMLVEEHGTT